MEEHRWNDDLVLTDKVFAGEFQKALEDERNKSVALHKPGSTVTMPDGTEYLVGPDGAWRRTTVKKSER